MTLLSSDLWQSDHDWRRTDTFAVGNHRLRVRVCRNEYNEQSFAISERFDGIKWHSVDSLPFPLWPARCQASPCTRADLGPVVDVLLRRTLAILYIEV